MTLNTNTLPSRPYTLPDLPADRYYVENPTLEDMGNGAVVFVEDTDLFDRYTYRLNRILYSGKTAFQNVLIADTVNYGRALMLDGAIQSAADDESLYHEMLVQPAMLRHSAPRDVLIIGGGEGATLREVLAHYTVKSVTMVDLDRELVELCREHMTQWHCGAFDDARVRMVYDDGRKFIENDDARYDVVIIDIVDMLDNGPAQALYTRQFYELLKQRLRPEGIVAVQGLEFSFADAAPHAALARTLRTVFAEVHSYHATIPSFLAAWGYIIASDWFRPSEWTAQEVDAAIQAKLGDQWLDHANGEYLKSCFSLCKETQFMLSLPGPIIEDGVELILPPGIEDIEPPIGMFPALKK